jgi:hypothetical protein
MQYRLRSLLGWLALGPPVLAWLWLIAPQLDLAWRDIGLWLAMAVACRVYLSLTSA